MEIHEVISSQSDHILKNLDSALSQIQEDAAAFKATKRAIIVSGDALTQIMDPNRPEFAKKVLI